MSDPENEHDWVHRYPLDPGLSDQWICRKCGTPHRNEGQPASDVMFMTHGRQPERFTCAKLTIIRVMGS